MTNSVSSINICQEKKKDGRGNFYRFKEIWETTNYMQCVNQAWLLIEKKPTNIKKNL